MPSFDPSVVLHDLTFAWPDGAVAIDRISGAFGRGRTGLVGRNGAGKSTLLRLIAGRLPPASGTIAASDGIAYLPQTLTLGTDATLADLLGVRTPLEAVRAIAAGDVRPELFDAVGDDWGVEERSLAALSAAGLAGLADGPGGLDRRVATLSGGETMLAALTGIRLGGASLALLDEPSNNLDRQAREGLYELIRGWRGALIVVSHDLELLELMDETAELREGALSVFGGPHSAYRAALEEQQEAARRGLRAAEQQLRVERRDRIAAETKLARSAKDGAAKRAGGVYTKAAFDQKKNSGEKTAAAVRGVHTGREEEARAAVDEAERRIRDDDRIAIELPDPEVASRRRIARFADAAGRVVELRGPERIALAGPNGAGKTTLLEALVSGSAAEPGRASAEAFTERIGYLPQRMDVLAEDRSVLDGVAEGAPGVPRGELRSRLARFLLRGDAVERPVSTLSGGERFRVALARLLLAEPPAQLLVLDEPTNNLDVASVDQLVDALGAYRGALLVVSHEQGFLDRLGLDAVLELSRDGAITERRL